MKGGDILNLKKLRDEKGMTQTDVAKLIGVSLTSYRMWEIEVTEPSPENMAKLKEVLDVK